MQVSQPQTQAPPVGLSGAILEKASLKNISVGANISLKLLPPYRYQSEGD